ncbi:hypothetical protein STHAL_05845 [Streptomyces halstedii]|uniref:DUF3558 domain-containing protein n=1 Tax=Streptomyces halstedii TaxID=1944 RepID=A0ABS6TL85_STRHA|nr:hypothetical protein [Streptomyces halstedii]MBV7669015.1 hypothetical protein [Streptomyces halstedii]
MRNTQVGTRAPASGRPTVRVAIGVALALCGASACSDGQGAGKRPEVFSAPQVCDGALSSAGAEALERIGGTGRFTEIRIADDPDYRWSLKQAVKDLQADYTDVHKCLLYKASDKSGLPLVTFRFSSDSQHPDPAEDEDTDRLLFPIGLYAAADKNFGTSLYFACPVEGSEGRTPYVKAEMYSAKNQVDPASTAEDRMTVLNDVSRALAQEAGCASEAKLPARLPAPTSG